MIKGCKKNVVYVRNTDSELFEEAYFILSDDFEQSPTSEPDMLAEANSICSPPANGKVQKLCFCLIKY